MNLNTISRYETGSQVMSGVIDKLEAVLAGEGVVFLENEGELGPGVRLKRRLPHLVSGVSEPTKRKRATRRQKR